MSEKVVAPYEKLSQLVATCGKLSTFSTVFNISLIGLIHFIMIIYYKSLQKVQRDIDRFFLYCVCTLLKSTHTAAQSPDTYVKETTFYSFYPTFDLTTKQSQIKNSQQSNK